MQTSIVWLRNDLRLEDNPALVEASKYGAVIPLYIWDSQALGKWPMGAASRWWLHHSLKQLQKQFEEHKIQLIIRHGDSLQVLQQVLKESKANRVFWNRRYEPAAIVHDAKVKQLLQDDGVHVQSFNSALLYEPWTIANKQGKPFQVFTPFWKSCLLHEQPSSPLPVPSLKPASLLPTSDSLESLTLLPKIHWDAGLKEAWQPGELAARKLLEKFLQKGIENYAVDRDIPSCDGVSKLSPYLHFGEISPRMIWKKVKNHFSNDPVGDTYLRQLGWREFAHHLLYHFPKTPEQPLRQEFMNFPWNRDHNALEAWQKGITGYPIVDAGMRQLWHTGWMHNRVRMVVGSFLVKDLLISWTEGAKWFWDTLVDANLANNTLGWQWVGGCGADAAPYFRVFNPVTQGEKFDPQGDYVKKWVPELAALPSRWIHRPWEAPEDVRRQAGGIDYPNPLVDHGAARGRALAAFAQIRQDKAIR